MNRQQRRAAGKRAAANTSESPAALFSAALRSQTQNQPAEAARLYKRLLALKPDHAEAHRNLGVVLQAQGQLSEASASFARALTLLPQLFEQFNAIHHTLLMVLPPLAEVSRQANAAWPRRLPLAQLGGRDVVRALGADPMLACLLCATPVRNLEFERVLTTLRAALVTDAIADDDALPLVCLLARQCFINEYVFATTPEEDAAVARRKNEIETALAAGGAIAPASLAALAMYEPLHALADASRLLERRWPPAVDAVVTQQLREPLDERALRDTIPRLTPIEDATSQNVRRQYEENPYPRWVNSAGGVTPVTLDEQLRRWFPTAPFVPLGKTSIDVLVAGCGSGLQSTEIAQGYDGARVLAIDLSLASLCYAKRKMPAPLKERLDYAQADILQLGSLTRRFDLIESTGVLHHMRDPFAGWRVLLSLLKAGGLMYLGFYSETGRRDVAAARAFIAEHGYVSTAADIRRCRQDLLAGPLASVTRFTDFFTTSECRDLLFHVQESRTSIPVIKAFIAEHGLRFIGFNLDEAKAQRFRAMFADKGWSTSDLDKWQAVESEEPDTFSGMYQLWVQAP